MKILRNGRREELRSLLMTVIASTVEETFASRVIDRE